MNAPNVFFSYAHEDEDLRDQLDAHLSSLRRGGGFGNNDDNVRCDGNR